MCILHLCVFWLFFLPLLLSCLSFKVHTKVSCSDMTLSICSSTCFLIVHCFSFSLLTHLAFDKHCSCFLSTCSYLLAHKNELHAEHSVSSFSVKGLVLMRCLVSRQSKKPLRGKTDQVGSHFKKDELLTLSLSSSVAATGAFSAELLWGSLTAQARWAEGLQVVSHGAHLKTS